MIFIQSNEDEFVKIEQIDLEKFVRFQDQLKNKASNFVTEKKKSGNSCHEEQISFTSTHVVWTFKKNTSCHCHPEYETFTEEFELQDFFEWLKLKNETQFWL